MQDRTGTRLELQRIATHVLARRRHAATGRFGLRATPGGFGTPAFGPDAAVEVLRLTATHLLHEVGGEVRAVALAGSTLAELARACGADLRAPLSVGHDTPPLGDPDAALAVDPAAATALFDWLHLGWQALDAATATATSPATVQLWPEHLDAGTNVSVGPGDGDRVNLGASLGDGFEPVPYLYVGPWDERRPGDAAYWNAPFGAVRTSDDLGSLDEAVAFLREGLGRFSAG